MCRDREEGNGGGCAISKQGMQYRVLWKGIEIEYLAIDIWGRKGSFKIVNFYNPFTRL